MSLDDIRLRESIDLAQRADVVEDELVPELGERIEAAESADSPGNSPDDLRDLRDRLNGQASACRRVVDALGGGTFVIQELMTAETAILTDDVSEKAVNVDYEREQVSGSPKQGYHKVRTLELSVVDAPESMETKTDHELGRDVYLVGKLPDLVSDHLYECVTSLNDCGEVPETLGNLSDYGVTTGEN